jgi:hypothetical protein
MATIESKPISLPQMGDPGAPLELVIGLQEVLMNLSPETISSAKSFLSAFPYADSPEYLHKLTSTILLSATLRTHSMDVLIELIQFLVETDRASPQFKTQLLLDIFESFRAAALYPFHSSHFFLLSRCHLASVYSASELLDHFTDFGPSAIFSATLWHFWFLGYFAPLFPADGDVIRATQLILRSNKSKCPPFLRQFWTEFDKLRAADWKDLRALSDGFRCRTSLAGSLKRDDLELLQHLSSSPDFDADSRISPSLWETSSFLQSSPTLLQYAAYWGSTNCFRFLVSIGANTNARDGKSRSLVEYAIAGGCAEVVRMLEREEMDGALQTAAFHHRQDLFAWLRESKGLDVQCRDREHRYVMIQGAQTNNLRLLQLLLEWKANPNVTNGVFFDWTEQIISAPSRRRL